jgi:hypothetical protein
MNNKNLEQLGRGLRERLASTVKAPLSPAMVALLAQVKERQTEKTPGRKRSTPPQNEQ